MNRSASASPLQSARRLPRACRAALALGLVSLVSVMTQPLSAADPDYRPGGKLAGVVLPLKPTQHGEPAGFPGSIDALAEKAIAERQAAIDANPDLSPYPPVEVPFTPQGMAPKEQLYEGSVEHYSAYWFKYTPTRTMFDRQSLIRNWRATELPEAAGHIESYAEPVYWLRRHGSAEDTGYKNAPVDVVRVGVGSPAFTLDCGVLEPGMYTVRVVGAVETEKLIRHRLPLYMRMRVNDGLTGDVSTYRMRAPYVDEFYSVVEFYFHAPVSRRYSIEMAVETGSLVDLLVYNIDLHDALAGTELRAIKKRRTFSASQSYKAEATPNTPELLAREELVWNSFPPPNSHTRYVYGMGSNDSKGNWPNVGAGGKTPAQIDEEFGTWDTRLGRDADPDALLINKKLGLTYTLTDYRAGRPLPDPYPYKDSGMGIYTPPTDEGKPGQNFWPVANGISQRMRSYATPNIQAYTQKGDVAAGRMAALRLIRVAYDLPAMDARTSMHSVVIQPGSWGRDHGNRRRDSMRNELNGQIVPMLHAYDALYDLIAVDQGLAESVGRFIPWVKTPEDVIALLDTYLVQHSAKLILRYQEYSTNTPHRILAPVNCLGDNEFTRPWMQWLFSSAFIYPLPPSGLQDLVTSANDRNGMGYISSHFYAHGEQSAQIASYLDDYVAMDGLEEYKLGDPKRYPKPLAACHWFFDSRTAGNYFPRIGDVGGPDKGYAHPIINNKFKALVDQSSRGWRWSGDPKFAWALATYGSKEGYSDEEWAKITAAAATVTRAPWYDNQSRVLSNWGAFLESGIESTDDRIRRSAMIRTGVGWGHQHNDAMDLQLHALGYPMTIDGGQRPGYTSPSDRSSIAHNLVLVDSIDWLAHSWTTAMSDVEDARYMRAQVLDPEKPTTVTHYSRQVALIDVDEMNSYVFDVQRVIGGKTHTHSFHAMLEDELTSNVATPETIDTLTGDALAFAKRFRRDVEGFPQSAKGFTGLAPDVLQATWRMQREKQGRSDRTEQSMHSAIWDPESPRKYTRLHLFGQQDARVISGWSHCTQWSYGWTNLYTRREGEAGLQSVFPAIIEPFAGEAFITERRQLAIADNETDALRAVVLQVTTRNGRQDLLFADGRPETRRQVGDTRVAAEFAHVSQDADGLVLATLTGGTLLQHPLVTIKPAYAERQGTITAVDYPAKTMILDTTWTGLPVLKGEVFEVGSEGRHTTYTIADATDRGGKTAITVTEGSQFYLSRVSGVDEGTQRVTCAIGFPANETRPIPGLDKHWVASNEAGTKFWRAEYLGDLDGSSRYVFQLDGPVSAADFSAHGGFRLWEYGVGDVVRQSSHASVRRLTADTWQVTGDVDVEVTLAGKTYTISAADLQGEGKTISTK